MQNSILEQARAIVRSGKEAINLEKAQQILMTHLNTNPHDTDAWLLLMRIECNSPFDDPERIIHYAQHVLSYDSSNPYALLFWAYADFYMLGGSDSDLYSRLQSAQSNNLEIMSMIELAKARYLELVDIEKCKEALKKSIEYCPTHAMNFNMLGGLYVKEGKVQEGNLLIEHGLHNIKTIFRCKNVDTWKLDRTSIEDFLDEFFSGISTNEIAIGGW